MVRSALILALVAAASGAGPQKKSEPPPLPPLNEKVVEFARENLGKPVGDGICITLAVDALREANAWRGSLRDPRGDYEWGELVPDLKDVLPGDILQFRDAVFHGSRSLGGGRRTTWHQEYPHHTAIVARVEKGGKLITIYHQNVVTKGKAESEKGNVQEGELRMDSLQKGGWIRAYRPAPPDKPPARKALEEDDGPGR
jgi:hypothetical protein